jgi:hypothetical protein
VNRQVGAIEDQNLGVEDGIGRDCRWIIHGGFLSGLPRVLVNSRAFNHKYPQGASIVKGGDSLGSILWLVAPRDRRFLLEVASDLLYKRFVFLDGLFLIAICLFISRLLARQPAPPLVPTV